MQRLTLCEQGLVESWQGPHSVCRLIVV